MRKLQCYQRRIQCLYEQLGALAEVTFRRVDPVASGPADPMFAERREVDKRYNTWTVDALTDERPRTNIQGRIGAEVDADVVFTVYDMKGYEPEHQDQAVYRGVVYEVKRISRVAPTGANNQLGYRIQAKRFR